MLLNSKIPSENVNVSKVTRIDNFYTINFYPCSTILYKPLFLIIMIWLAQYFVLCLTKNYQRVCITNHTKNVLRHRKEVWKKKFNLIFSLHLGLGQEGLRLWSKLDENKTNENWQNVSVLVFCTNILKNKK